MTTFRTISILSFLFTLSCLAETPKLNKYSPSTIENSDYPEILTMLNQVRCIDEGLRTKLDQAFPEAHKNVFKPAYERLKSQNILLASLVLELSSYSDNAYCFYDTSKVKVSLEEQVAAGAFSLKNANGEIEGSTYNLLDNLLISTPTEDQNFLHVFYNVIFLDHSFENTNDAVKAKTLFTLVVERYINSLHWEGYPATKKEHRKLVLTLTDVLLDESLNNEQRDELLKSVKFSFRSTDISESVKKDIEIVLGEPKTDVEIDQAISAALRLRSEANITSHVRYKAAQYINELNAIYVRGLANGDKKLIDRARDLEPKIWDRKTIEYLHKAASTGKSDFVVQMLKDPVFRQSLIANLPDALTQTALFPTLELAISKKQTAIVDLLIPLIKENEEYPQLRYLDQKVYKSPSALLIKAIETHQTQIALHLLSLRSIRDSINSGPIADYQIKNQMTPLAVSIKEKEHSVTDAILKTSTINVLADLHDFREPGANPENKAIILAIKSKDYKLLRKMMAKKEQGYEYFSWQNDVSCSVQKHFMPIQVAMDSKDVEIYNIVSGAFQNGFRSEKICIETPKGKTGDFFVPPAVYAIENLKNPELFKAIVSKPNYQSDSFEIRQMIDGTIIERLLKQKRWDAIKHLVQNAFSEAEITEEFFSRYDSQIKSQDKNKKSEFAWAPIAVLIANDRDEIVDLLFKNLKKTRSKEAVKGYADELQLISNQTKGESLMTAVEVADHFKAYRTEKVLKKVISQNESCFLFFCN